jgi:hypothetical protein
MPEVLKISIDARKLDLPVDSLPQHDTQQYRYPDQLWIVVGQATMPPHVDLH